MVKRILHIILFIFLALGAGSQFVISPGSSITITDGTSFHVGTNLYIKSDATGSGHLADQNSGGDITITGDISIEQYLAQDGWHNVSVPLSNITSSSFTGTDLVFYYDETLILNDWNFGWVLYDGSLEVMRGYDVFLPSTITTTYYSTSSSNLNSGIYNLAITRTNPSNGEIESHKGWNLIGNPYPSPVDWLQESGWNKNDINDAKYIWNPDNNNYTIFLGGASPTGINGATQYIPANQGFWVQAIQNGSVQINNSSRFGVAESTPGYYKNDNNENEIRLLVSGNGYKDETLIRFIDGSNIGFDINLDASKLFSFHDNIPQINSVSGGSKLAINTLPEIYDGLSINIQFTCNTAGTYTIKIDSLSSIDTWNNVYLYDKLMNNITEISQFKYYIFSHNPANDENRFTIFVNPSEEILSGNFSDNSFAVTTSGTTITVKRNTDEFESGIFNLYNLTGQKILSQKLKNTRISKFTTSFNSGYYIASIVVNQRLFNFKILITK